ncbi:uncharacterized protein TNCV_1172191 [Trichonephila clavipes]|uniref:Uncharacterized protein n=1 Tax=Trichonephila clavipes TaxID=2585209 RepID=A0A8X6V8I2_TRICX|nr:uncharacterized protein TNCV_1172191 [Trichonephila clavipes]
MRGKPGLERPGRPRRERVEGSCGQHFSRCYNYLIVGSSGLEVTCPLRKLEVAGSTRFELIDFLDAKILGTTWAPLSPAPSQGRSYGGVRYVTAMYIYTIQDALFICCKQSPNALSVAFSQRVNSPRLIEDETFNDGDVINNLIDYEDGIEEPDFLRANKIYAEI